MSAIGGISAYGGAGPAPGAGRRALPRAMGAARLLLHVLFGATLLGAVGLFGSALAADAVDGVVLGVLLYGAVPGVVGWLLSRRAWTGGRGVWGGLVAVQVWLVLGGLANAVGGSVHGFTQVFLPVVILVFLTRAESRAWFRLPEREREKKPEFSFAHMITWRRDRGQTALEYLGLVTVVVAVVAALVLSGVGGRITDRIQAAICSLTGTSCPATGTGSDSVNAGGSAGGADTGGADSGGANVGGADGGATVVGGADGEVRPAVTVAPPARAGRVEPVAPPEAAALPAAAPVRAEGPGPAVRTAAAVARAVRPEEPPPTAAPPAAIPRAGRAPPAPGVATPAAATPAVRPVPTGPARTPTPRPPQSPRPSTTTSPHPARTKRGTPAAGTRRRTAAASSAAPGTASPRSSRASPWTASGAM